MKRIIFFMLLAVFFAVGEAEAFGSDIAEEYGEYFDFSDIQDFLNEHESGLDFEEIIQDFGGGDVNGGLKKMSNRISDIFFAELKLNQSSIKKIIIIAIITAMFTNFGRAFKGGQVSETGFQICYVTIITYLIGSFTALAYIAYDTVGYIVDFMKVLLPVYTISVGFGGHAYALSFYQMTIAVIAIIDFVCLKVILPVIDIYIAIGLINNMSSEDYFSKTCELIKNGISFLIKIMYTSVMGINIIQRMFQPITGSIKGSALKNTVNIISGLNDNSITELIYGTGNILKGYIGGAGIIVLFSLVMIPVIKIIIFIFTYQLSSAVIQPISDKRINECITIVSNGAVLILRTIFAEIVLFLVTITLVCV